MSVKQAVVALLLVLPLGGCKIVSDKELAAARAGGQDSFDAAAYVDKHWNDKALADFKNRAVDLDTLLPAIAEDSDKAGKTYGQRAGEGNPWTYEIRGLGKVVSVDIASRHGIVSLGVAFGTAFRDALPTIHFGDFVNQIQYAQVSRALNDRAVAAVHGVVDRKDLVGKSLTFYAAATIGAGGATITATPVVLELSEDKS
jgi:predicted lipoprotein